MSEFVHEKAEEPGELSDGELLTLSRAEADLKDAEIAALRSEVARLKEHAIVLAETARVVEQKRIAALIAQHSCLTLETLDYLETMRQGPSPAEWAELDSAARA